MARGSVWLSPGQATLYLALQAHDRRSRVTTLRQLTAMTASSSRGRTSDRLARLRALGVVGYRAARGRHGYIRWWWGGRLHRGVSTAAHRRRQVGNDSLSPFGGFLTVSAYARRAREDPPKSGLPPGPGGRRAGPGPHRGRPPRLLYARCDRGHLVRTGRWTWMGGGRLALRAEYRGRCRRCRSGVAHTIELPGFMAPHVAVTDTDPVLAARRARFAAEFLADDPRLAWKVDRYLVRPTDSPEPVDNAVGSVDGGTDGRTRGEAQARPAAEAGELDGEERDPAGTRPPGDRDAAP